MVMADHRSGQPPRPAAPQRLDPPQWAPRPSHDLTGGPGVATTTMPAWVRRSQMWQMRDHDRRGNVNRNLSDLIVAAHPADLLALSSMSTGSYFRYYARIRGDHEEEVVMLK